MCKANLELLTNFIKGHINEKKSLDEWRLMINVLIPSNRRLTTNELAFAIRVLKNKNLIEVQKTTNYYLFESVQSHPIAIDPVPLIQSF